jgi:hypothetical protein
MINDANKTVGKVPACTFTFAPTTPSIRRPPKELQGFAKEFLQSGQKKELKIAMQTRYATGY